MDNKMTVKVYQIARIGLIKDGKIGAGKIRAAKIAQVLNYTKGGN